MKLELRKVKINKTLSEETTCFSAELWVEGVKAGVCGNRGDGGCNFYNWDKPELGYDLHNWARAQPLEFDFEHLDQIISELLDRHQVEKDFKQWTKKKTCFRLIGDGKTSWRTINKPFDLSVKSWLTEKYGGRIECIMNESLEKALELSFAK